MSKRVLITGTSTGFGRDAAERLASRGDHVFATMRDVEGRNAEHREALERLATQEGLRLRVLALDVTDQGSVDRAVAAAAICVRASLSESASTRMRSSRTMAATTWRLR